MTRDHPPFAAKILAPAPRRAQPLREDRDVYGVPEHDSAQRTPERPSGPSWPYDDWPLPFASFWTSLLLGALCYPARALLLTLAAVILGSWLGVRLDRWLRKHPEVGGPRLRFVLGIG